MLAFSAAPPVPHVVSSLRCAEWLHGSVNVINVIHYWQYCSLSPCCWFHYRNASSKAGLLFIYSRGFYDFTISLASTLFISYWLLKKVIQCCFQIKSIFCPPRGSHQGDPLWCVFEILELSQVGADQVSSWSFKSFSHRGSWRKHHVQGMTLEGLRWSRVPRVSREGISHARDHHYLFSVSSSLPCSCECISVSSNLPSSWCAVELLQNPRATVKVTQL